ncbi:ArsR/SmtB family transcription factor [Microbacterium gorillae]|uniref:ArsR/SmtB family transcription factor n=1 Tax=Microbacterium gorillae TaxID=1231063 RepID=UPI000590D45A|nr:helix-turn-helix domain-containing protein [Microbacterium gorillae]
MFQHADHDEVAVTGIAGVFAALANADRVAIVRHLRAAQQTHPEGLSITALADAVGLTRFATSRHLKILGAASLVAVTAAERALLHRLDPSGFLGIEDWIFDIVEA